MLKRDKLIRAALRERFIATLRNGETFDGLLLDADEKTYRFANAYAVDAKGRVSVDGELFIPREEVIYIQRPGASA